MTAKKELIQGYLERTGGVLRLAPAWVTRTILPPGRRLKLRRSDLYPRGASLGAVSERWMASTGMVDNGPATAENEGLSFIAVETYSGIEMILLKEAIDLVGGNILGEEVMSRHGCLKSFAKLYDFSIPIPHHVHLREAESKAVGVTPKPEAYYFPEELNSIDYAGDYTYFGLEPGTTKEQLIACLRQWDRQGDNGILELSRAYKLTVGTGWNIPAGILHAPGSLVTYEPQRVSDNMLIFQPLVRDQAFDHALLTRFVPEEKKLDEEYLIDCLDWAANVDPEFRKNHYHMPVPVLDPREMNERGYEEMWVVYGSEEFSAKRLVVHPGRKVTVADSEAYGFILMEGYGTIDSLPIETPAVIGYTQLTCDEYFVTRDRARQGVTISNPSNNAPIVMLKHFGPGNGDSQQFLRSMPVTATTARTGRTDGTSR